MDLWTMPSQHVALVAKVSHAFYTHLSSKYEIDSNLLHARIHWISVQQDRQEIWQRLQAATPTLEANVPVGWFADSAAAQEYGSVALDIDEEFSDILKHIVDVQPEEDEDEPDQEPTHHPNTKDQQTAEYDADYQEYLWDQLDRSMAAEVVRNPWHEEFGIPSSPTTVGSATRSSRHRPKQAHPVLASSSNPRYSRNHLPQSPNSGIMIASTRPNPLRRTPNKGRLPSPVDVIDDGSPISALSAPSRTYPPRIDQYDAYLYYNDQRSRPRTWTAQGYLDHNT